MPSSFFSSRFVSVHVVNPYSSIDVTAAWKKLRFILSVRSDFHIIDSPWQLHKNAACNPEQVLAATPHKTPTIRPPAPYHENYSS